ncbi:MAG: GMP synthase [Rhodospirillales bacterium]|jgi:GMP synthase-like glutamine amidotransferase|uniref:type 1 glutamine amidotransferase n=1 Tax=Hwanghaeella sp. 1Z406 TaxID=3402811 RepID=UPI000C8F3D16|nr:GMP synthase [Rhodospirillales bacterium]MAO92297.1 GMP synthase [Rhodospirillales bacterium]|tara:strand:+ start:135 stop:866 length:732 start_codon:yes stop_codon:yes gene_type:complete
MRLGILEAGRPPAPLDEKHGTYPGMFQDLLRSHLPDGSEVIGYPVIEDGFPRTVTECDAWLITGSAYGVYDDVPFIGRLIDFIQDAHKAGVPMVGICFGHQIIAQALGGQAGKSEKGWGVGAHSYTIRQAPSWMGNASVNDNFDTYVSHQDQVTAVPPGATVLASSDFCNNAMLAIGDKILTLQSHPEMPSAYVGDLYDVRRARIGEEKVDAALTTVAKTSLAPDADRVATWIGAFLTQALES